VGPEQRGLGERYLAASNIDGYSFPVGAINVIKFDRSSRSSGGRRAGQRECVQRGGRLSAYLVASAHRCLARRTVEQTDVLRAWLRRRRFADRPEDADSGRRDGRLACPLGPTGRWQGTVASGCLLGIRDRVFTVGRAGAYHCAAWPAW
jgi:hypothetical protein